MLELGDYDEGDLIRDEGRLQKSDSIEVYFIEGVKYVTPKIREQHSIA